MSEEPASRSEGQISRSVTLALAAGLVCLFLAIGYQFLVRGRAAEAEFTITGQTQASRDPAVTFRSSAALDPRSPRSLSTAPPANKTADAAFPTLDPLPPAKVIVHVAGAVKKPGVYKLEADARVEDALKSAGGAVPGADINAVNLAARVEDGSRIYFPTKQEAASNSATFTDSAAAPKSSRSTHGAHGKFSQPGKEFVNINTANAEQLQQLPGVGPSMSARILAHRKENGPFSDPSQLMDVVGIGPKKYDKMKPFIRIR